MSDQLWVGLLIGLTAAWAYHAFGVPRGAPAFPIVISYDRTGEAVDRTGVPFTWVSPGR